MDIFRKTFAILLLLCITLTPVKYIDACEKDSIGDVMFYTDIAASEKMNFSLLETYERLGNSIAVSYEIEGREVLFGNLLSVINCDGLFYIPVFCDSRCVCIVKVYESAGKLSISYCDENSALLNTLKPGKYYLEKWADAIYLLSDSTSFCFESLLQKNDEKAPIYDEDDIGESADLVNLFDYLNTICIGSTKGILSKELTSVPYVANGGTYGYCWLSSAVSICRYYGSSVTLEDAHRFIHGLGHSLISCPGGSIISAYGVIHNFTGLSGNYSYDSLTSRINAANAYSSIYNDIPVYSFWSYYDSLGSFVSAHSMVICGYIFNNTSGDFTYVIMDPNYSSRQYVYSTYTASTISYTISGDVYDWEMAIYDWN